MSKRAIHVHRRALLRGAGVALGLPWLEAMMPRSARASTPAAGIRTRVAWVYHPNGMNTADLMPATEGRNYEITPTLEPLSAFRDDVMILSGLGQKKGIGGGHSQNSAAFLTGADARNGVVILELGTSF